MMGLRVDTRSKNNMLQYSVFVQVYTHTAGCVTLEDGFMLQRVCCMAMEICINIV